MLFKVLSGSHAVQGEGREQIHYSKGETVESDIDLVDKFGGEKFSQIYEDDEPPKPKRKRRRLKKSVSGDESDGD